MKEITLPDTHYAENFDDPCQLLEKKLRYWNVSLCGFGLVGCLAGVAGAVISVLLLTRVTSAFPDLDLVATVLIIIALCALIIAAHSLDRTAEIEKCLREERGTPRQNVGLIS
jgi:hypothetical protein